MSEDLPVRGDADDVHRTGKSVGLPGGRARLRGLTPRRLVSLVAGLSAKIESLASGGERRASLWLVGVPGDHPVRPDGFDADAVVMVAAEGSMGEAVDDVADG
ncbi:hypothetical protein ACIOYT_00925 [Streptomyces halstedii]|uniref:hypothetical protein n=1 Tax=Streptomyces halstedii TaxID=1944 RepID=UPI0037FE212B